MPFISLSEVIDLYFATLWIKRLHHALHLIFPVLQEKQFPFAFVVGCSSGGPTSEGHLKAQDSAVTITATITHLLLGKTQVTSFL